MFMKQMKKCPIPRPAPFRNSYFLKRKGCEREWEWVSRVQVLLDLNRIHTEAESLHILISRSFESNAVTLIPIRAYSPNVSEELPSLPHILSVNPDFGLKMGSSIERMEVDLNEDIEYCLILGQDFSQ